MEENKAIQDMVFHCDPIPVGVCTPEDLYRTLMLMCQGNTPTRVEMRQFADFSACLINVCALLSDRLKKENVDLHPKLEESLVISKVVNHFLQGRN